MRSTGSSSPGFSIRWRRIFPLAGSAQHGSLGDLKRQIVIVGGGLAGLSLGIALRRRDVPVSIHEAGSYPRHRVCGEFISGVSDEVLETLGIARLLADAVRLETARWNDGAGPLGELRVAARGISRWVLDRRLAEDFQESGGVLHTRSRAVCGPGVVWAAGRLRRGSRWLGLKVHANELPMDRDLEMFAGSNGYVGLARIECGRVNICGLFRADRRGVGKGVDLLLSTLDRGALHPLTEKLRSADLDAASFCAVAGFEPGSEPGPEFSIGDASQMIPPFTGNGMSMAFESAAFALDPLMEFSAGRIAWSDAAGLARKRQRREFRRRMFFACGAHGFLTTPVGTRIAAGLARRRLLPYGNLLPLVR